VRAVERFAQRIPERFCIREVDVATELDEERSTGGLGCFAHHASPFFPAWDEEEAVAQEGSAAEPDLNQASLPSLWAESIPGIDRRTEGKTAHFWEQSMTRRGDTPDSLQATLVRDATAAAGTQRGDGNAQRRINPVRHNTLFMGCERGADLLWQEWGP
jgi:hypothetical protein